MKIIFKFTFVFLFFSISLEGSAQKIPSLSDIPDYFTPLLKKKFDSRKTLLLDIWNSLKSRADVLKNKCGNVPAPDIALNNECKTEQEQIEKGKRDLIDSINAFNTDVLAVQVTVIKVYHLTAKSWINGESISEFSFNGIAIKNLDWDSNIEPLFPNYIPNKKDYKLYQSFVVKVEFTNEKVVSAKFIPESLECRGGTSNSVPSLFYVKESRISDWKDKESVTFKRTVAAHSNLLLIKEILMGNKSPDIWNSIEVEIYCDKIVTHTYASDFPTTYFWIGDELFAKKLQVQPADYFK